MKKKLSSVEYPTEVGGKGELIMISYWKTQWFNLLMGAFHIGIAISHFCSGDQLWGIAWTVSAVVWFLMSFINYNEKRIELLEKRVEALERYNTTDFSRT